MNIDVSKLRKVTTQKGCDEGIVSSRRRCSRQSCTPSPAIISRGRFMCVVQETGSSANAIRKLKAQL
jgi:hypothetical protein